MNKSTKMAICRKTFTKRYSSVPHLLEIFLEKKSIFIYSNDKQENNSTFKITIVNKKK